MHIPVARTARSSICRRLLLEEAFCLLGVGGGWLLSTSFFWSGLHGSLFGVAAAAAAAAARRVSAMSGR